MVYSLVDRTSTVAVMPHHSLYGSQKLLSQLFIHSLSATLGIYLASDDLGYNIQNFTTVIFADDTTFASSNDNFQDLENDIREELHIAEDWFLMNYLAPNCFKANHIIFSLRYIDVSENKQVKLLDMYLNPNWKMQTSLSQVN